MNTRLRECAHRFRWIYRTAAWIAMMVAIVTSVAGAANGKLTCGKPRKSGRITVHLVVQHGSDIRYVTVPTDIDTSVCHSAADKAGLIRAEFWARVALRDTVKAVGTTAEIDFQVPEFWHITNIAVGPDSTDEPDEFSLGVPVSDQEALCSLAGTASGHDLDGQAGYVRLTVGAANVLVPTQAGMSSDVVEQFLIQQMNQMGIPARFATPADFVNGAEGLPHDPRVIWFPPADTTGFLEDIHDTGLALDLASMMNTNANLLASLPDAVGASALSLDVFPTVFSRGSMHVRYASPGGGPVRVDVFDVGGRRVQTLLEDGGSGSAVGVLSWTGVGDDGARRPQGVYFVRLTTPRGSLARRVVCIRD